ncbi:MAG: phage holin family protein [Cytophagaceae bacterium]|nr:phage holin family protein [Cytophagaceae bacterium]
MNLILHLLIDAAVIFGMAYILPQVDVKSFGTALLVAIVLGLLNATVGWVLRGIGDVVTLGIVSFVIRLVVTALLLKLVDRFFSGLTINGFWPALVIALAVAVAGAVLDQAFAPDMNVATDTN